MHKYLPVPLAASFLLLPNAWVQSRGQPLTVYVQEEDRPRQFNVSCASAVEYEASFLKYSETDAGVVAIFEGLAYPIRCKVSDKTHRV